MTSRSKIADRHRRRRARHRWRRARRGGGDGWRRLDEVGDDHEADHDDDRATTTTVPPTTAPPLADRHRSPGCADPSGESHTRPALSVKVENTPDARPQAGIDQADVVYEEEVEGNITRFLAIFNSTAPGDHRPGPLGAAPGPRHRLADPRHLRLLRWRRRSRRGDQRRAGARGRQQRRDRQRRERDGAQRARPAAAPVAAQPLRPRSRALLARRRPEAAAPAVRSTPCRACRPRPTPTSARR